MLENEMFKTFIVELSLIETINLMTHLMKEKDADVTGKDNNEKAMKFKSFQSLFFSQLQGGGGGGAGQFQSLLGFQMRCNPTGLVLVRRRAYGFNPYWVFKCVATGQYPKYQMYQKIRFNPYWVFKCVATFF